MTESLTIVQCQRIIGRLQRKIDRVAAEAERAEVKAELCRPNSYELTIQRGIAWDIRTRMLPELYTLLHHYQSRLPEQQTDRSEAITRRLLGLSLIA